MTNKMTARTSTTEPPPRVHGLLSHSGRFGVLALRRAPAPVRPSASVSYPWTSMGARVTPWILMLVSLSRPSVNAPPPLLVSIPNR